MSFEKIAKSASDRPVSLIISLVTGLGFFGIIQKFINNFTAFGGSFLGFLFFPAIVCGMALINIKLIIKNTEHERYKSVFAVLLLDIFILVAGIVFFIDILQ